VRGRDAKTTVTRPADTTAPVARAIRARARQMGGAMAATFAEDATDDAALGGAGWGALLEPGELALAASGPRPAAP
jgi:hypothetical protein